MHLLIEKSLAIVSTHFINFCYFKNCFDLDSIDHLQSWIWNFNIAIKKSNIILLAIENIIKLNLHICSNKNYYDLLCLNYSIRIQKVSLTSIINLLGNFLLLNYLTLLISFYYYFQCAFYLSYYRID